jgi:hypothetical protein
MTWTSGGFDPALLLLTVQRPDDLVMNTCLLLFAMAFSCIILPYIFLPSLQAGR